MGILDIDSIFSDLLSAEGAGIIALGLVIAFMVAIFIAISAGWFRIILSIASFAYPAARVRAIGNPLITREGVESIVASADLLDLFERAEHFGHHLGYREGLSADDCEHLIRSYHYRLLGDLAGSVPDAIRPLITAYTQIFATREVAAILRGIAGNLPRDLIMERAVPVGGLSITAIRKAAHADTIEEAVQRLERSGITPGIREQWMRIGEPVGFAAFEAALVGGAYQSLMMTARGIEDSQYEPAVMMAGRMIDCENLRILARGKIAHVDGNDLIPFLIPQGGFEITIGLQKELARTTDLIEMAAALRDTMYGRYFEPLVEGGIRKRHSGEIEIALNRCLLDVGRMNSSQYHLGSGPIIRYLLALEMEIANLGAAAGRLILGIGEETGAAIMVTEGGVP